MEQSDPQDERSLSDERRYDCTDSKQSSNQKNNQQRNNINADQINSFGIQNQKKNHMVQITKSSEESLAQCSLEKIAVQSPLKHPHVKIQLKNIEKSSFSLKKNQDKFQQYQNQKEKKFLDEHSSSKNIYQSGMKSTLKSNQRHKKVNKPFYEETFYITGMKQNYLLLLSDNNQVLEFPVGMFTTKGGYNSAIEQSEDDSASGNEQFQIMKDIKIGQPIKIKLELDIFRQEKDQRMFNSLQRKIHDDYGANQQNKQDNKDRNKQMSRKKSF